MRCWLLLLTGLQLLSLTALAEPPGTPLTERQRAAIAMRAVREQVKPWLAKGQALDLKPAVVPFNGDARHPITGSGPIELYGWVVDKNAKDSSGQPRVVGGQQKFLVNVCANGKACLLEQTRNGAIHRIGRFFGKGREILGDAIKSKEILAGASQITVGTIMASGGDSLSKIGLGTLLVGAAWIGGAIKGRNDGRRQALAEVVGWAKSTGETTQHYPHLIDAYRRYTDRLQEIKPGTRPLTLKKFAEQLSANGL